MYGITELWAGGGFALCLCSLCFGVCLSGTLLAGVAEGKEKPDWVCIGVKCPNWDLSSSQQWGCSASAPAPAPASHKAKKSDPARDPEGKGWGV